MPAFCQAQAVFKAQPPFMRWAMEAYILAAAPFPDIAKKLGLMVDAVTAYERLFFAVTEHLDCTVWIVAQAIGEKAFTGLTEQDLGLVWKLLGYHHGPVLLDNLILNVLRRDRPDNPAQVEACIAREMQCLLQRHGALAALFLPVNQKTALKIVKLCSQQRATEHRVNSITPGASESIHIEDEALNSALINSCPKNSPEEHHQQLDLDELDLDKPGYQKTGQAIPYTERVAG